jgi:hypothetical protein
MTMKISNLGLLFLAATATAMSGCSDPPQIPSTLQTYNYKNGAFKIDYPTGWEVTSGGTAQSPWVKFTSGDALIKVSGSVGDSLKVDAARAMGMDNNPNVSEEDRPVAKIHEDDKKAFAEDEEVAEKDPVVIKTGFGDGRKSEYTFSKTFGGDYHGYRATALGRDLSFRVICEGSQNDWKALQPLYDKVIESISQGRPEQ